MKVTKRHLLGAAVIIIGLAALMLALAGCSGVRPGLFDSTLTTRLDGLKVEVCSIPIADANLPTELSKCATYWADVYNKSKQPLGIYLSASYDKLVADDVARSQADASAATAGKLNPAQMRTFLTEECQALTDLQSARDSRR